MDHLLRMDDMNSCQSPIFLRPYIQSIRGITANQDLISHRYVMGLKPGQKLQEILHVSCIPCVIGDTLIRIIN